MSERLIVRLVRAAAAAVVRECDAITREQASPQPLPEPTASVPTDEVTQRAARWMLQKLGHSG